MAGLSSKLNSIFSSDSSDEDSDIGEEFETQHADKPVFLTAKGPVHLDAG